MATAEETYIDDAGNYRKRTIYVTPKPPRPRHEWNYKGQVVKSFDPRTGKELMDSDSRRGWF